MVKKFLRFLLFAACFSFHKGYSFSDDDLKKFSTSVDSIIHRHNLPGIVLGVVSSQKIIYKKIHGVKSSKLSADDPQNKVDSNTVFRVASVTKFFTGILLEILSNNGKIDFDDSILHHLPQLRSISHQKLYPLKLYHITNHTSGLMPYFMVEYENNKDRASLDLLVKRLNRERKVYAPGKIHAYQNVLFNIIALFIEKKMNSTYHEALNFYVMKPLNIDSFTILNDDFLNHTNKAIPSCCIKNLPKKVYANISNLGNYDNIMAAGGLALSFKASAEILQAILAEKQPFHKNILENLSKKKILTCSPSRPCSKVSCLSKHQLENFYGCGCRIVNINGIDIYYHSGALRGVSSLILIAPSKDIALFAYINTSSSAINEIFSDFCTILCGPYIKHQFRAKNKQTTKVGIVKIKNYKISRKKDSNKNLKKNTGFAKSTLKRANRKANTETIVKPISPKSRELGSKKPNVYMKSKNQPHKNLKTNPIPKTKSNKPILIK